MILPSRTTSTAAPGPALRATAAKSASTFDGSSTDTPAPANPTKTTAPRQITATTPGNTTRMLPSFPFRCIYLRETRHGISRIPSGKISRQALLQLLDLGRVDMGRVAQAG